MSAETFTSALFLITAIIAAGVLINAVFPVVYNMAGTFSSASHESDQRIRTDFKIITTAATTTTSPPTATIWIKNVGSSQIAYTDIYRSDVFCGTPGSFDRLTYTSGDPGDGFWTVYFTPGQEANLYWDPGETIKVEAVSSNLPSTSGGQVYFQFILPNGIWRSTEFTAR